MSRWTLHLLTAAVLIAPTLHATVVSTGVPDQSQYSDPSLFGGTMNFYSGSYSQPSFSNVGVPTYPIMGTTTVINTSTLPANLQPQVNTTPNPAPSNYSNSSLNQQIVSNYNTSLVAQDENIYNPTNSGYGYSYGSNPAITAATAYSSQFNDNSDSGSMFGGYMGANVGYVSATLRQQVNIVTNTTYNNTANLPNVFAPTLDTAPEPGTVVLLAGGLAAMFVARKKMRKI